MAPWGVPAIQAALGGTLSDFVAISSNHTYVGAPHATCHHPVPLRISFTAFSLEVIIPMRDTEVIFLL